MNPSRHNVWVDPTAVRTCGLTHRPAAAGTPWRVVFITTQMSTGGAERLLAELIGRLDPERFESTLVCLKGALELGDELRRSGTPVYERLSRGRFDVSVLGRLATVLRRERPHVVCTVGTGGDRSFWGRLAAWWAGVPVIVSCPHSMGAPDWVEPHNRMLSAITHAFVAVATLHRRHLIEQEGLPSGKIEVIHNGVDAARFAPGPVDRALRAMFGIPTDARVAGVVSRFRREKNLPLFLRVAAAVHHRMPTAHFLVVGEGPERPALDAAAAALGVRPFVHFAGLRSDVDRCIRAMDVCLLTSRFEAFPVSLLEAMACGKPVIATDVGAVREMVHAGMNGLLAPSDGHAELTQATLRLLADPMAADQMGRRGRAIVERHFTLDHMVSGYEGLFERLLAGKSRLARERGGR